MKKITAALILSFLCSFYLSSFVFIQPIKAVTVSSQAITKVGNPSGQAPGQNQTGVDYAYFLVQVVHDYCGGQVTLANEKCLDNIPNLDPAAKSEILDSDRAIAREPWLQCVGFVSAVLAGSTGQPLSPIRDAFAYADFGANGFTFIPNNGSDQIQPGDLAVWGIGNGFGDVGHIAYVVKVESDPTYFTVAQANYPNTGIVSTKQFQVTPALRGWLRKQ